MKITPFLSIAFILVLAGCTNSSPTSPTSSTSSTNSSSGGAITNITINFYTHVGDLGTAGPGTADGQFSAPNDVLISADGAIYAVDAGNYRIQKFSSNGSFVAKWGSYGNISSSLQFMSPTRLTTDEAGSLYVLDSYLARMVRCTTNGVYTASIPNFIVTGGSAQETIQPSGLWVTGTNAYMIDYLGSYKIQRFDNLGNWITNWTGTNMPGGGNFSFPRHIVSNGNFFYVYAGGTTVRRYNGNMSYASDLTLSTAPSSASGTAEEMVFDGSGNFFISSSSPAQISKYNSSGTLLGKWSKAGTNDLKSPRGIALDATGRLYVADNLANRVFIFAPYSSAVTNIETY